MFSKSVRSLIMKGTRIACRSSNQRTPEGFSFMEKLTDKDITAAFEPLPKLILTMTRQDELLFKQQQIDSLRVVTATGEIGIKAGHAYTVAKLVPGIIEIERSTEITEKYYTAGGFAHINNDGSVDINTVEAIPLGDIEPAYVDRELLRSREELAIAKTDKDRAIHSIYIDIYESIQTALKSS